MKTLKVAVLSAAVLLGVAVSASVLAHGGHPRARVGVFIGAPIVFAPWFYHYPYPYYYYPYYPRVAVPASPPVYIEQGDEQPAPAQQAYWYYCPEAKAYHPYVKQCPGGWQWVVPQPPPS